MNLKHTTPKAGNAKSACWRFCGDDGESIAGIPRMDAGAPGRLVARSGTGASKQLGSSASNGGPQRQGERTGSSDPGFKKSTTKSEGPMREAPVTDVKSAGQARLLGSGKLPVRAASSANGGTPTQINPDTSNELDSWAALRSEGETPKQTQASASNELSNQPGDLNKRGAPDMEASSTTAIAPRHAELRGDGELPKAMRSTTGKETPKCAGFRGGAAASSCARSGASGAGSRREAPGAGKGLPS